MRSLSVLRGVLPVILSTLVAGAAVAASPAEGSPHAIVVTMSSDRINLAPRPLDSAVTVPPIGAAVPEGLLLASFDGAQSALAIRTGASSVLFVSEPPSSFESAATEASGPVRYGLGLSKPDRWTSVITTLALCIFFFLRRMV